MAPVVWVYDLGTIVYNVFGFLLGIGFGFALERAGFGNARKMGLLFYFRDFTVLKVMFTAIVVAMTGFTIFRAVGILNWEMVYLNPTVLWPGIVGGLIMGFGFVIGGYCPGTSFVGLVSFKQDAIFYILGTLFGMFVFAETEILFAEFFRKEGALSGFLGPRVTLDAALGIPYWLVTIIIVVIALGAFYGAEWVENRRGEIVQPNE